jgi:uncharacterized membrane protein
MTNPLQPLGGEGRGGRAGGQAHLWAVGWDHVDRAGQVREVVVSLPGIEPSLQLLDIGVLVRLHDGSLMFNGESFSPGSPIASLGVLGLLTGFALAVPLLSADTVARVFDSPAKSDALGLDAKFRSEIASMMRPGTSALLVLDVAENMQTILPRLQGLGGRILKTNVDIERANLIQTTLAEKTIG